MAAARGVVRMKDHRSLRTSFWRNLKSGRLVQALPGIAMVRELAEDPRAWIRAVNLWNPNAVIAGCAAASITFDTEIPLTTVSVHVKDRIDDRGPLRFIAGQPDSDLLEWKDGIQVTGPEATALTAGLEGQLRPGTEALRLGVTTPGKILDAAEGWTLRSRRAARAVALDLSGNPWSPAEVDFHRLLRKAGIQGWQGNQAVWLGGSKFVPDASIHAAKIAFEVNSVEHHSSREAMEQDASRLNTFLAHGWRSYAFIPSQIRDFEAETIEFLRSVVWKRHRLSA
ncbi:hypothetical protein GCM10028820_07290 [Tessaracoccus terricola]